MTMDTSSKGMINKTKASLWRCSIGGVNFIDVVNGQSKDNFHVQEFRIYEDNCKFYFTAQLVIEAHLNTFEEYLVPQADVVISFSSPPNIKVYSETFKVYSYESKPREGDNQNSMVVTISLMGKEYFRDKSKQIQQNFKNEVGTEAARKIHVANIEENGPIQIPLPSIGMIGKELHPHQVLSKVPSKAIHDILDKSIFPVPHFGPAVYFRNYPGYVIAPLEWLLKSAPIKGNFMHQPGEGMDITHLVKYDRVIHFRPMSPPGEDRGGARSNEFSTGGVNASIDAALGKADLGSIGGSLGKAASVGKNMIDNYRQDVNIDKAGPGGFQAAEDNFISQLTYSPKYWISVPLQSGIDVTVGDRVTVYYPVSGEIRTKTLWVARLIHEVRFTEGKERTPVSVMGTTDLFCVDYRG